MGRKQKRLDDGIYRNKFENALDLESEVVCCSCMRVRCDFILSGGGTPDQVRVPYTQAGGSTGFTSKGGSCSVRVRHWLVLGGWGVGDADFATKLKLDGRVGVTKQEVERLGVKREDNVCLNVIILVK